MNRIYEFVLKSARKCMRPFCHRKVLEYPNFVREYSQAKKVIIDSLNGDTPCMIARYGAFEAASVLNSIAVQAPNHSVWDYLTGKSPEWWWNKKILRHLQDNAGFFPLNETAITKYAELMIEDSAYLDVLGCSDNNDISKSFVQYHHNCIYTRLAYLEPDYNAEDFSTEWTSCLKGKKVLIIHPFAETIQEQYKKRDVLFNGIEFIPEFELLTIKAVQSIGEGADSGFKTWFDALSYMENAMDKLSYDICIIGCGAYGFHLAAHAKRTGHKAFHLGGATQLLFGIMGRRWENREDIKRLVSEYWVRPSVKETPVKAMAVEGGCYW